MMAKARRFGGDSTGDSRLQSSLKGTGETTPVTVTSRANTQLIDQNVALQSVLVDIQFFKFQISRPSLWSWG
jgi:hypothetical protein